MADLNQSNNQIQICLLGSFSLAIAGNPMPPLRTRKGQWLLSLLALRYGRSADRSWIAGMLWPDSLEEQSLCNLRRALTDLRSALGPASDRILAPTARTLALQLQPGDEADIHQFQQLIELGDLHSLQRAIDLYRGPLLEGCDEHWVYQERLSTELAYLTALETLAARYHDLDRYDDAISLLKTVVSVDPLRESAQRSLMRAYSAGGNLSAAVLVYRDFRVLLSRDLNSAPDTETSELYQQIRTGSDAGISANHQRTPSGSLVSITAGMHHLPRPLTGLVGRASEIASIVNLMADNRLISLVGPGGIGKTRLAIHAAQTAGSQERYSDGVWFADLSGISVPDMLPSFAASIFDIPESSTDGPLDRLLQFLQGKELLLVVDNCEHMVAACAELAQALLNSCPNLGILATSREPLGIVGEYRWSVPALSVPAPATGPNALPGPDALLQYDAVRLFVERGKSQRSDFALTAVNAASVTEICSRLDGIPLAIELAAARISVLTPDQIALRLQDRFRLLTFGSRTAWPRHQTLLALIDWSHDLLTEPERVLFRRLAVFTGGWTVDDLEAVCCSGTDPAEQLDLFTSLLDKSLVQADAELDGERRYRMLETIREFSLEKLKSAGEWEETCRLHASYYLSFAEAAKDGMLTVDREVWIHRFNCEHDNLRSALTWTIRTAGEAETAARIANGLVRFWYSQCFFTEGLHWFEQILALDAPLEPSVLSKLYNGAGSMLWSMGDLDGAQRYYELHLELQRVENDLFGLSSALQNLGLVAMHRGEYPLCRSLMEESVALIRKIGDKAILAGCLNNLAIAVKDMGELDYSHALLQEGYTLNLEMNNRHGMASMLVVRGNLERRLGNRIAAKSTLHEALTLYTELNERQGCAISLHNLGDISQEDGDLDTARRFYEQSLAISRDVVDRRQIATTLCNLGQIARDQGDLQLYRKLYKESADMALEMKERVLILTMLTDLAEQASISGNLLEVSRLLGSISGAAEKFGVPLNGSQNRMLDLLAVTARERLGETSYCAVFGAGAETPLDHALLKALDSCVV